jgi:Peptidase family M23
MTRSERRLRGVIAGMAVAAIALATVILVNDHPDEQNATIAAAIASHSDPASRGSNTSKVQSASTSELASRIGASLLVEVSSGYPFIWPADGPLTSEMGPWHPLGIDIGLDADEDSPVRASAGGVVTFAGGEAWEEFGFHVVINHGSMETLYGHLERIVVQEGDVVHQGQLLGLGGSTGVADGKHLHFEVHSGGSRIDPEHVLPPLGEGTPEPFLVDCALEAITIESGAPLLVDFEGALSAGSSLTSVTVSTVNVRAEALPVSVNLKSDTSVRFDSTPTVEGIDDPDEYLIIATSVGPAGRAELTCTVLVRARTVEPSFYVRPTNTPTPLPPTETPIPPTATATPTPTPTATPTKTPFPARS